MNVSLSDKGRKHAVEMSKKLENRGITAIYSSALKRTIQTADIISKRLGVEVKGNLPQLNEVDFGVIEGLTREEAEEKYPEVMGSRDKNRLTFKVPGGESGEEAAKRALPVLQKIAEQNNGNVLVVLHGFLMRVIMCKLSGIPIKELYKKYNFYYGCRVVLGYDSGSLSFKEFIEEVGA